MTPRWLAPICALLALGTISPDSRAKNGDLVVQFSTDPDKPVGNLPNLDVRANTARKFYLFITNNSGNDRDAIVQLTDAAGKTVYAVKQLKLDEKKATRIAFAKPPAPMPPPGAAAPPAVPPMPVAKVPPPPPGAELISSESRFVFRVRIFDDRDKDKPSEDVEYAVVVPQPVTYVKPVTQTPTYFKKGQTNQLTVEMKTEGLIGTLPCPVELSFPPQAGLKAEALREGVYKQSLSNQKTTVRLYAKNLPLVGESGPNGYVYIAVDGVPRSYVYRPKLHTETGDAPAVVDPQTEPAIRYMEASKIQTADTIYVRPGIVPIRVEADAAPLGASIQLNLKRISEPEVVQSISRPSIRDQRAWLEPAAPDGSILVTTVMGDWVIPLDVRDYRGRYELRAILVNPSDRQKPFADFKGTLAVDDTKPEEVSVVVLPDRPAKVDPPQHIRTLPLPVKVVARDPESKIVKVVVYLGKPTPDGKVPEAAVEAKQPDPAANPSTWLAQVPLPMGAKGLQDVTAVATNAVGLSEASTQRIQLLDPPTTGTIRGTVSLRAGGKALTDVGLILRDADGKDKGVAKTNEKGIFEIKEVPPGTYKLFAARPDSGVGTRAVETVTVHAGEISIVRMILSRRP